MPVVKCSNNGKPGWKWGSSGTCYGFRKGDAASEKKAKALARKQGLAVQLSSGEFEDVDETKTKLRVDEAALPLLDDESYHDFRSLLYEALETFYTGLSFWWIESVFGDAVITEVTMRKPGGMERWTERVPFTRAEGGAITLGDATRVALRRATVVMTVEEDAQAATESVHLEDGETLSQFTSSLRDAVETFWAARGIKGGDTGWVWVREIFEDSVIVDVNKPTKMDKLFRQGFVRTDRIFTLGAPVEVEEVRTFVPVGSAHEDEEATERVSAAARIRNALAMVETESVKARAALEREADAALHDDADTGLMQCLEAVRGGLDASKWWSLTGIDTPTAVELERAKNRGL